jgi:hypothetical protein
LHGLVRIGRARTFFAIPLLRRACQQKATVSARVQEKYCIARRARIDTTRGAQRRQATQNRRGIAAAAVDEGDAIGCQRR